jgi:dimethylargininase
LYYRTVPPGLVAITREISPSITRCELTHFGRTPIDIAVARRQHAAYEQCLSRLGCAVVRLEAGDDLPDSVFIEDTAVVFDEVAVIARPGAESRRGETGAVAAALARYRSVVAIEEPGTLDGGDVLVVGKQVFVGLSGRTNREGVARFAEAVEPFGYSVHPVEVGACLHLKSAVTSLAENLLLVNPDWVDESRFAAFETIAVAKSEPGAANALTIGGEIVFPRGFPLTRDRLESRGLRVHTVDADELAKAEGAVTCCSLILRL